MNHLNYSNNNENICSNHLDLRSNTMKQYSQNLCEDYITQQNGMILHPQLQQHHHHQDYNKLNTYSSQLVSQSSTIPMFQNENDLTVPTQTYNNYNSLFAINNNTTTSTTTTSSINNSTSYSYHSHQTAPNSYYLNNSYHQQYNSGSINKNLNENFNLHLSDSPSSLSSSSSSSSSSNNDHIQLKQNQYLVEQHNNTTYFNETNDNKSLPFKSNDITIMNNQTLTPPINLKTEQMAHVNTTILNESSSVLEESNENNTSNNSSNNVKPPIIYAWMKKIQNNSSNFLFYQ
jgi:hypothetical protein